MNKVQSSDFDKSIYIYKMEQAHTCKTITTLRAGNDDCQYSGNGVVTKDILELDI